MRLILLCCFWCSLVYSQSDFKKITFSNQSPGTGKLLLLKQVPGLFKVTKSPATQPHSIKPLNFIAGSGSALPSQLNYTYSDEFYFWAENDNKTRLNLRAISSSIHSFLAQFKQDMKIRQVNQEFIFSSRETDELGIQHIRVQQVYKNLPVYGGELIIHGHHEDMTRVNGKVFPTPVELNTVPTISETRAITTVVNDLTTMGHYRAVSEALLKILKRPVNHSRLIVYFDSERKAHIAYAISYVANGIEIWNYIIDAQDGQILNKFKNTCSFLPHDHSFDCNSADHPFSNNIPPLTQPVKFDFEGKTTSNAMDLFGKQITLQTYEDGGRYYLLDASKTMFKSIGTDTEEPTGVIWTFDGKNKSPAKDDFNPGLINGATNNGWISPAAASAHLNAGLAYTYYLTRHARNSINGKGGNVISLINIVEDDGEQMDNAFWNGEAMFYGNGKDAFTSLAKALDVAGHEISHGVVQSSANLDYEDESGALNESFADIFGRLIDRDDWLIGEEVVKKSVFPSGALRSFIDPHNGGSQLGDPGYQPRTYAERYKGTEDNGGVHINSGIANWAFYQFTIRINNDLVKAEKVYYRALTRYLTRSSRFIDCRKAVIQSAADLFGANSPEVTAARAAYDFVGILEGTSTPTQEDVETNPGGDFIVYADDDQTALYLSDEAGNLVADPLSSKDPLSKASVTDDGSSIVFVGKDKKIHYVIIDWNEGKITDAGILQNEPIWRNASISRDGHRVAALKDIQENFIHVYDYTVQGGEWREFELYNPTFSTGIVTGDVNYADAIEFDYTGNLLMYDAENTIKNSSGAEVTYWDISFLRVYDGERSDWGDGKIAKLFGQLPEQTSVGNPTFAKNSPHIIAFDMLIESTNPETYLLLGGNTETGRVDTIFINSRLSWPSYSTLDNKVIFNAQTNTGTQVVGQINVNSTKIRGTGTASALINNAQLGTWFANGSRNLSTPTHEDPLKPYKVRLSPNPAVQNEVNLSWQQPQSTVFNHVELYDMVGRLYWTSSKKYLPGAQSIRIPINDLPQGIYLIKVNIEGKSGGLKFVRQ